MIIVFVVQGLLYTQNRPHAGPPQLKSQEDMLETIALASSRQYLRWIMYNHIKLSNIHQDIDYCRQWAEKQTSTIIDTAIFLLCYR